jgi:hydrogenase expression/formation protein HypC
VCLAVPGKITSVKQGAEHYQRTGLVDFGGVARDVSLAYVPEAAVGDYVMVHVGFAISVVDEEEAGRVFALLREMGEGGRATRGE